MTISIDTLEFKHYVVMKPGAKEYYERHMTPDIVCWTTHYPEARVFKTKENARLTALGIGGIIASCE